MTENLDYLLRFLGVATTRDLDFVVAAINTALNRKADLQEKAADNPSSRLGRPGTPWVVRAVDPGSAEKHRFPEDVVVGQVFDSARAIGAALNYSPGSFQQALSLHRQRGGDDGDFTTRGITLERVRC